jgi:hypothetical protein
MLVFMTSDNYKVNNYGGKFVWKFYENIWHKNGAGLLSKLIYLALGWQGLRRIQTTLSVN